MATLSMNEIKVLLEHNTCMLEQLHQTVGGLQTSLLKIDRKFSTLETQVLEINERVTSLSAAGSSETDVSTNHNPNPNQSQVVKDVTSGNLRDFVRVLKEETSSVRNDLLNTTVEMTEKNRKEMCAEMKNCLKGLEDVKDFRTEARSAISEISTVVNSFVKSQEEQFSVLKDKLTASQESSQGASSQSSTSDKKPVYKKRDDFPSKEEYRKYVMSKIKVGMKVKCLEDDRSSSNEWRVSVGDIGTVTEFDDGYIYAFWTSSGGVVCLYSYEVEILG